MNTEVLPENIKMPLIHTELPLWEIAFRWAERPPARWLPRIPLEVKDHFRNVMQAILSGELACETLSLEKFTASEGQSAEMHIGSYINDVYECIWGRKFNRHLLRHAIISRA